MQPGEQRRLAVAARSVEDEIARRGGALPQTVQKRADCTMEPCRLLTLRIRGNNLFVFTLP